MLTKRSLVVFIIILTLCASYVSGFVEDVYDGYSMPEVYSPRGFESISTIIIAGNVLRRAKEFNKNTLSQAKRNGLKWVRWQVNRKQNGTLGATIAFQYPSRIKPIRYELVVFNNGKEDLVLPGTTVKLGEEKVISVPATGGTLNFYLPALENEKNYDIYFRGLKIFYPMADGLETQGVESPDELIARRKVDLKVNLTGPIQDRDIDVELVRGRWILWRIRLTESEIAWLKSQNECVVSRNVPWYLASGDARFVVSSEGYRVCGPEKKVKIINSYKSELPQMERRNYNGTPTLFKNGRPFTWTGYATYNWQPGVVNEFAQSGANVFWITVPAGKHLHHVALPTWYGGEEYDFGQLTQRISTGLQANPDADFILRVNFGMPHFWYDENPDSRVLVRTENGDVVWEETSSIGNSLADEKWREKEVEILNKLVEYIKQQPWAERVIGFLAGSEVTEEWFAWASNDKQFADYSPVNERAFQKWLKKNNSFGVDFDRIPDPNIRDMRGYDVFPDTKEGKWAAAYNKFYNELTSETILYYANAIKKATDRRSLVIVLYGYVIQLLGEPRQSISGHFDFRPTLDSPDIDCFMGIPLHNFRFLTNEGNLYNFAYDTYVYAYESLRLAGKIYNNDNDIFSWLHPLHWHKRYDPNDPRGGAISMHRRVFANDAIHGAVRQWFSLSPDWHHDKQLQNEFASQIKLLRESLNYDRTPTDEIAFVVDNTSFYWFTTDTKFPLYSHQRLMAALATTGAPVGVWLFSDIDKIPDRIKFIAVSYSPAATKEDIQKLKAIIEKGGRTILVVGTIGLVDTSTGNWDKTATADVTGLDIIIEDGPKPCRIYNKDGQEIGNLDSWRDIYGPNEVAPSDSVNPRAYLNGEGDIKYQDGKTAIAERDFANNSGKLIWLGMPPFLDIPMLKGWLEESGVHFYGPTGSFVYSSKDLVSVTWVGAEAQELDLNWPQPSKIEDLFDGWSGCGKVITCPFKPGQTRLFLVKRIKAYKKETK